MKQSTANCFKQVSFHLILYICIQLSFNLLTYILEKYNIPNNWWENHPGSTDSNNTHNQNSLNWTEEGVKGRKCPSDQYYISATWRRARV
jgi:hypothetical protein